MAFYLVFTALVGLCSVSSVAELLRLEQQAKADGSLSFLVVGDWGRRGSFNQSRVGLQMGRVGEELDIDFVVSTGDNFYDNGLSGIHDTAFEKSFSKVYTAPSLQKQWYNVLGNHDYRGKVEAQLSPILTKMDSRWLCLRSFILNAEIVEFYFVDTTPFVDKYFTDPEDHDYDWKGVLPRCGHGIKRFHSQMEDCGWPPYNQKCGTSRDTVELVDQLLPILQANSVDLYINGHDHCLEHISSPDSPIQFLTSGGGSKAWRGDVQWWNPEELKFYYDGQGFMSVQITASQVDVAFYDVLVRFA
ncbi:Purple acid phosphatase 3 [Vitis vinifera]|uniref:Purple acid phosphatase n=1 Tax=Vitis vinifera TaxID=29760 RepID=A0A438DGG4_VITVI|nr:Purple acid phosphatase 3 [Vitis vinifera]